MKADHLNGAVSQGPRPSPKLFSDFNNLQYASVMGLVMVVLLFAFMIDSKPISDDVFAYLPRVLHPVSMPGADSQDAITITILRDGQVYFRAERVTDVSGLPTKIKTYLKDPQVEHRAYIRADVRARWGRVKQILEAIHEAGIVRVAFLAGQRKFH